MSLTCVSAAWAALHPDSKHLENRWFTVEEDESPYVEGVASTDDNDDWAWMGQYYYNDQTFVNFKHQDSIMDFRRSWNNTNFVQASTDISGSYLWNNGFFIGLEYADLNDMNGDEWGDSWGIHPGFRWNLKWGYLALSMDYYKGKGDSHEFDKVDTKLKGLEFNWVYYPENMKIKTDLILAKSNTSATFYEGDEASEEKHLLFDQTLNYKVADNLVLGFGLTYDRSRGEFSYSDSSGYYDINATGETESTNIGSRLGFTWEPTYFILNGAISATHSKGFKTVKEYDFKLIIPIYQQFNLGFGYSNESYLDMNHENKSISFQYDLKEDAALRLSYNTDYEIWSLLYHQDI